MDRPLLGGAIKRTPQRLAIYRHHPAHCDRKSLHPGDETTLKLLRVQPRKHVPQLVVRRHPMRERQQAAQKSQLALAIERNLDPAIGPAKHCAQTQQQDFW